jgi:hypothetical protein
MSKIIKTDELTLNDVPDDDADVNEIFLFALTFDPMLELGTTDIYKYEFIKHDEDSSLQDLRRSLFLWQRGWNFVGKKIDYDGLQTLRDLLALMRNKLTNQTRQK